MAVAGQKGVTGKGYGSGLKSLVVKTEILVGCDNSWEMKWNVTTPCMWLFSENTELKPL